MFKVRKRLRRRQLNGAVYGSFAAGLDGIDSDVDIALAPFDNRVWTGIDVARLDKQRDLLRKIGRTLGDHRPESNRRTQFYSANRFEPEGGFYPTLNVRS